MPTLWRMSNYPDLNGTGGLYAAARWHFEGHRVVYLADSPSTALLETLVHLEVNETTYPDPRKLLEILVPEDCGILELKLPEGNTWIEDLRVTQELGTEWLRSMASPRHAAGALADYRPLCDSSPESAKAASGKWLCESFWSST